MPGLKNPLVTGRAGGKLPAGASAVKPGHHTRIPEPRWQQLISVLGIVCLVALWLLLVFLH